MKVADSSVLNYTECLHAHIGSHLSAQMICVYSQNLGCRYGRVTNLPQTCDFAGVDSIICTLSHFAFSKTFPPTQRV